MAQSEAHQTTDLRVVGSSPATLVFCSLTHTRSTKKVHPPGLEPGSPPWKGGILPLDHECYCSFLFWLLLFLFLSHLSLRYPILAFFSEDPIVQMVGHLPYYHLGWHKSFALMFDCLMRRRWFNSSWDLFFLFPRRFFPFRFHVPFDWLRRRGEYSSVGRA